MVLSRAEAKAVIESWRRHTTRCGRIRAWAISRRPRSRGWKRKPRRSQAQRAGALRCVGPPRPGPLRDRPMRGNRQNGGQPSQANPGPKKQAELTPDLARPGGGVSPAYSGAINVGLDYIYSYSVSPATTNDRA